MEQLQESREAWARWLRDPNRSHNPNAFALIADLLDGFAEGQGPTEIPEEIERMAADRYKVVPSHESMAHRWAVVAGIGAQQLYLGREVECQNMARKFAGAFLDGAFVAMQHTAPQPASELGPGGKEWQEGRPYKSGFALAAIGREHFGNPIPQEWYAAARQLLKAAPKAAPSEGNWINADNVQRLVRQLDVALNGENGAALQASLCDIVGQVVQAAKVLGRPVFAAPKAAPELGPDGKEWAKTEAGYKHVESMMSKADGETRAPYWHGWALRGAFVAGAEWQEGRGVCAECSEASTQGVPDGWQLVPNAANMTDGQAEAIAEIANCLSGTAYDIYKAALKVAPLPDAAPEGAPKAAPKDHELRELVNRLRDIAREFHGSQQLRERIAAEILPMRDSLAALIAAQEATK